MSSTRVLLGTGCRFGSLVPAVLRDSFEVILRWISVDTPNLGQVGLRGAIITDRVWQMQGACRGPQAALFFPPPKPERRAAKQRREQIAKAICSECEVRTDCLDYALDIRELHGIWGGMNELERRTLLVSP